jgi:hypothetical protein
MYGYICSLLLDLRHWMRALPAPLSDMCRHHTQVGGCTGSAEKGWIQGTTSRRRLASNRVLSIRVMAVVSINRFSVVRFCDQ